MAATGPVTDIAVPSKIWCARRRFRGVVLSCSRISLSLQTLESTRGEPKRCASVLRTTLLVVVRRRCRWVRIETPERNSTWNHAHAHRATANAIAKSCYSRVTEECGSRKGLNYA